MDINVLIAKAKELAGDNKELSSALGEIESTTKSIIDKKAEVEADFSSLKGNIRETGKLFGVEDDKAPIKDVLEKFTGFKSEADIKLEALSGTENTLKSQLADLQIANKTLSEGFNDFKTQLEGKEKENTLLSRTTELEKALRANKIVDDNSVRLAMADIKVSNNNDILGIEDVNTFAKEYAENNKYLTASSLNGGENSHLDPGSGNTGEYRYDMSVQEKAEFIKNNPNGVKE
jgi:hypothetical protein